MSIQVLLTNKKPHIVLAGGGHAHVLALPWLAKQYQISLVSEQEKTLYSGMFPGYLYGAYSKQDLFINLKQLAQRHGVAWHQESITGIDKKKLLFASGKTIDFDILSVNTGSVSVQTAKTNNACAVRPMPHFINWCDAMDADSFQDLCIIGAGAGAFEMALALNARWQGQKNPPKITLIGHQLLTNFPLAAQKTCHALLVKKNIRFIQDSVIDYNETTLQLNKSGNIPIEKLMLVNGVRAADWLKNTPLARDATGFICVNNCLQSINRADIFAVGDVASHPQPLPKAGVMATRQSLPLAKNLIAMATGQPLSEWKKRHNPLYILNTADGMAIACLHGYTFSGRWVWYWKNYLDMRFMRQFNN